MIRQFVQLTYPFSVIKNGFNELFLARKKDSLRVIIFHDISVKHYEKFKSLILWLSKNWNFISPSHFEQILQGKEKIKGN